MQQERIDGRGRFEMVRFANGRQPPEFQLEPLPKTNPILEGVRWKHYHYAMGPTLHHLPDISWKYVQEEKSSDMIHVLQFPYNGEPPRVRLQKDCG